MNFSLDRMTSIGSSHQGDNESAIGLTTPSSTQASSPSASPALSLTDDRKRNKSESEDNHSQRNRFIHCKTTLAFSSPTDPFSSRTNSGATNSSITNLFSPKTPSQTHQSPSVSSSSTKSSLSTSAPPHFTYPTTTTTTTTLPVLQYSAIVSQNTTTTTSSNTTASKQQQNILSPQPKPTFRQLLNGTNSTTNANDSIATTATSSLPISSITTTVTNSSNMPSLLPTNNDRSGRFLFHFTIFLESFCAHSEGILPQHILNNISQSSSTSTSTIPSSLYTNSGSNSNIPLEPSSTSTLDPAIVSQPSALLSRETDRPAILSNGSSDSHIENAFSSIPSSSSTSAFFTPNPPSSTSIADLPSTNGGVLSQLANSIPINPDHHSLRYMLPANVLQQQSMQTGRVPLTQAEMRMLNRLNSAYAKLPSLLESERHR